MLIDTHAHLYWDSFKEDFDRVIKRSLEARVSTIINVGVDIETSKEALDQARNTNWPQGLSVYSTIGIHPHEAVSYGQFGQKLHDRDAFVYQDIIKLEEIYRSNPDKVAAVGECGLDFSSISGAGFFIPSVVEGDSPEVFTQRQLFQAQIELAKKLNLPLIVHCRDDRSKGSGSTSSPPAETSSLTAWEEVLEMIKNHPAILHCYSGLDKTTQQILKMPNTLISFAATITYPKNEYLREAARILPLDRIVLETDCPFLPPQSKRGQRNEPSTVKEIAQLIADLKGISFEEVGEQTTRNAKEIFKIK